MSSVITEVAVQVFKTEARTAVDSYGHRHSGPSIQTTQALLRITDSDGDSGYVLGKPNYLRQDQLEQHFEAVLLGADPFAREAIEKKFAIRQRTRAVELPEHTLSYLDQALWDLVGNKFGTPVWKLLGGARSEVKAYASTMCGDDVEGGLSSPEDYANFAVTLKERGYRGIKLHTWIRGRRIYIRTSTRAPRCAMPSGQVFRSCSTVTTGTRAPRLFHSGGSSTD